MRMKQEKGEAQEFLIKFGEILTELNPAYQKNTLVRGVRTEFIREIKENVYLTHNVLCKKGTYYHGFCLTLHKELSNPYLLSPFTQGGRFDHNFCVQRAVSKVLGHTVLSSSHNYRKNWQVIAQRCTKKAEEVLLPNYLEVYEKAKEPLKHLKTFIYEELDKIYENASIDEEFLLSSGDLNMKRFSEHFYKANNKNEFIKKTSLCKRELFVKLKKA